MLVGGSSPASDVVITVEPARTQGRSWSEESRAAVRNNGSGLRGWIAEEAVWMFAPGARGGAQAIPLRKRRRDRPRRAYRGPSLRRERRRGDASSIRKSYKAIERVSDWSGRTASEHRRCGIFCGKCGGSRLARVPC
jgi:hypothetical protein